MKTVAAVILTLVACGATSTAFADGTPKKGDDSDVTIGIMDEGETPTQFSNHIQLPQGSNIVHAGFDKHVDAQLHDASKESRDASEAASENATQSIKDSLSVNGEKDAPTDITDHLNPDQPVLNQVPENSPDQPGGN